MNVITCETWEHVHEVLFAETWNEKIGRFRSAFAYRGLSDVQYPLSTTLMRLGGDFEVLEQHLLRNFAKYAHRNMVSDESMWHWLSVAQHHGLPTRLLDWTHSPLVALHFATCNTDKYDVDGAIWAINYEQCHNFLPKEYRQTLVNEGANTFTTSLLSTVCSSLQELSGHNVPPFVLFFEPPSMDDRIINQYALFSVMSDATVSGEQWAERYPDLCKKIVIPAELKWEVRDKLDQSNITERVLFPGLDGLSKWLSRHYSPKSNEFC